MTVQQFSQRRPTGAVSCDFAVSAALHPKLLRYTGILGIPIDGWWQFETPWVWAPRLPMDLNTSLSQLPGEYTPKQGHMAQAHHSGSANSEIQPADEIKDASTIQDTSWKQFWNRILELEQPDRESLLQKKHDVHIRVSPSFPTFLCPTWCTKLLTPSMSHHFPWPPSPHLGGHNPKPSFSFYISTMSINDVLLISGKSFKKKSRIFQNMTKKQPRKNRSWLKRCKIQVWKRNKWLTRHLFGVYKKKNIEPSPTPEWRLPAASQCVRRGIASPAAVLPKWCPRGCLCACRCTITVYLLMSPTWCPSPAIPAGIPASSSLAQASGTEKGFSGEMEEFTPNLWPFDLDLSRPVLSTPVDLGVTYGNLLSDKGTDNLIELLQGLIFSFMWYSCAFPHSLHKMA